MFDFLKRRRRINLALQGGGAHGAFTWGVLDGLLEESGLEFGWISGTSAGAVNAVALAAGLAEGGCDGARAKLRAVWEAVQEAGVTDLLRFNPFLYGLARSSAVGQIGSLFSPYEFNPLGFDPLRKLIAAHIDFTALKRPGGIELLITATDVSTGRARHFRRHELTIEAVLASTCLPTLHHAVEIDGRAYWDGGFSANPELVQLAAESPVGDTLLVLLNPVEKPGLPRSAREIALEVNRVTFSQPLLRDIREIVAARCDRPRGLFARRPPRQRRLAEHRYHLIEAGRHTGGLPADSKLRPDKDLLKFLHGAGREEARRWLARSLEHVGRRSTVDLERHFLRPLAALPREAAGAVQPEADAAAIAEKL